jgi:hypothetical protein
MKRDAQRFSVSQVIPKRLILHSLGYQLILALPFLLFFVLIMSGLHDEPAREFSASGFSQKLTVLHFWIALFASAAFFSCLGALISYSARGHVDESYVRDGSLALSMHLVGSVFGVLLLLLFLGGFIAGTLFPSFADVGFNRIYQHFSRPNEWAKLFVWSFLAGFSERLMPDLLQNVARRINEATATTVEPMRPGASTDQETAHPPQ